MKHLTTILFGFGYIFISQSALGQISYLKIDDNWSYPLKNDDGIQFKYKTESCGDLSAYFKYGGKNYILFSDRREFYGVGYINISPESLQTIFCTDRNSNDSKLILSHNSCRGNNYSQKTLYLNTVISAPYGCKLHNLPSKPNLYSTNLKIRKTNPLSVLGLITGGGTCVAGLVMELDVQSGGSSIDSDDTNPAHILLAVGALVTILSYPKLYKYVPDEYNNARNEALNRQLMSNWRSECDRIESINTNIKNTFKIKIYIR